MLEISKWGLCVYEIVTNGSVSPCGRLCAGSYCPEHKIKVDAIDELEKEVSRIVKGRKKK